MRRALPALAAATLAISIGACGDRRDPIPPQPELVVTWVTPASPDPFAGIDSWRVTLASDGNVVIDRIFAPGESPVLEDVLPQQNVVITLEACSGGCGSGSVVSRGRTVPFEITGQAQTISMWFARTGVLNVPTGTFEPRARPAVGAFANGSVLIAGGYAAGAATASTDLYDARTDTIASVENAPAAHAAAAGVMLSSTAFLLAGGDGTNGATSAASVWIHGLAAGTGSWRPVTPLAESRAEMGFAPLGPNRAVLVGGSHAGGIRSTIEVFTWDGNVGSWVDAEPFTNQVMGASVLPMGDTALIAGGYRRNVTNGNLTFRDNTELLSFDGASWTILATGPLDRTRGYAAVFPAGTNRWVLAGGLTDTMANPGPPGLRTITTSIVTWNGVAMTATAGADLPVGRRGRRGNYVILGDQPLLLGGDDSRLGEIADPLDRAITVSTALTYADFGISPGPTLSSYSALLPDGTTLLVTDGGVYRWNPP